MLRSLGVPLAVVLALAPPGAMAQSVADFYRGKTVSVILGYPGGGSNGIYARAVARHIGKYIPGNPTVIFRSMPGARQSRRRQSPVQCCSEGRHCAGLHFSDHTAGGIVGVAGAKFKSAEFNWIGRVASGVNMTFVKDTSPVKSIQDVYTREVILGASGRSSTVFIYPAVLSNVIGAKFKMVMGYPGSPRRCWRWSAAKSKAIRPVWRLSGASSDLAERQEDHCSGSICAQAAPGADRMFRCRGSLAAIRKSSRILKIVANATEVGKMIMAPPAMPADRVQALRRAFDATMADPEFVAELKANRVELGPMVRGGAAEARGRARQCVRRRSSTRSRRSIR